MHGGLGVLFSLAVMEIAKKISSSSGVLKNRCVYSSVSHSNGGRYDDNIYRTDR
jgi:hypothetical protein